MRYENRQPVEDLHAEDIHPLKEFAWLIVGAGLLIVAMVAGVSFFAGAIAAHVPYSVERDYAAGLTQYLEDGVLDAQGAAARASLRELADSLGRDMDLPDGMPVSVHYSDASVANAMATLGGNVIFFRGLLAELDSEDAVAMVLAHEIAHARLRHPVTGLGRGIAVGLVLSTVSSSLGELAASPLGQTGSLPLLKYSRDQERAADEAAFQALGRRYGHLAGAQQVFALFEKMHGQRAQLALLQTHPLTAERRQNLSALAKQAGLSLDGAVRPLPPALAALRAEK